MAPRTCTCDRCPKCHHRAEENARRRRIAYGLPGPMVDAEPVRQHVRHLMASGVGQNTVIIASGVPRSTVRALLYGAHSGRAPSSKIRRETAEQLLAVQPEHAVRISALGVQRRIQALIALGWSTYAIADRIGTVQARVWEWSVGRREYVTPATNEAVREVYDLLSMTPGPSTRARRHASRNGYAPPLAWDDDTIDDPMARPNFGRHEFGYASRKLPDPDVLVAEVNQHGVVAVAHRYKADRSTVHKALRRAGYRASHTGDTKQTPIYRRDAA